AIGTEAVAAGFEALAGLLQRFDKGAADGHHLAYRFHLQAEFAVGPFELGKVPPRHFHDDVIERRLEIGRGGLGDLVLYFIQVVADSELRRNLCNGVARCFGGQRGRARHARVDFNGDDFFVFGIHRKLHVTAAGEVSDGTHHLDGLVSHFLVTAVAQRHAWCHRDRVAGMHAHWVEVFDGTDNDYIVGTVAQQFQFELLPPQYGLFYQHFVGG